MANGVFSLSAVPGNYDVQVLLPTAYSESDLARDPLEAGPPQTMRRLISTVFQVGSAGVLLSAPNLAFDYSSFAPTGGTETLPTQFSFQSGANTSLALYGAAGDAGVTEIGDAWFVSAPTIDGGALFTGSFTTAAASEDASVPNKRYMWGTLRTQPATDAGVGWQQQTMVFPIVWP